MLLCVLGVKGDEGGTVRAAGLQQGSAHVGGCPAALGLWTCSLFS